MFITFFLCSAIGIHDLGVYLIEWRSRRRNNRTGILGTSNLTSLKTISISLPCLTCYKGIRRRDGTSRESLQKQTVIVAASAN